METTGTNCWTCAHPFEILIIDFRFDMMGKRVYKTYVNLSNIIVRISDGTPEGKEHAVLFNAHLDSTLPSPGAADDAFSVGIMLDCIRVLVETPDWSPKHAIIFRKFTSSWCSDPSDCPMQCSIMRKNLCKMVPTCFRLSIQLLQRGFCSPTSHFQFNPNFSVRAAVNLEGPPIFSRNVFAY